MEQARVAADRDVYLVWSNEHGGWWRAPSGYTAALAQARHFTRETALKVCRHAMPGTAQRLGMPPELPVRLSDVIALSGE